jgi:hypothetical protein
MGVSCPGNTTVGEQLEPPGLDERPIAVAIELSAEEIIKRISSVLLSSEAPGNLALSTREGTS